MNNFKSILGFPILLLSIALPAVAQGPAQPAQKVNEDRPEIVRIPMADETPPALDNSLRLLTGVMELRTTQNSARPSIRFALILSNDSEQAIDIGNPIDFIRIDLRDDKGSPVWLPQYLGRLVGNFSQSAEPREFILPFSVDAVYLNERIMPDRDTKSLNVTIPARGKLKINCTLDRVSAKVVNGKPRTAPPTLDFPGSIDYPRGADPLTAGRYGLKISCLIVNPYKAGEIRRWSSEEKKQEFHNVYVGVEATGRTRGGVATSREGRKMSEDTAPAALPIGQTSQPVFIPTVEEPIGQALPKVSVGHAALDFEIKDMNGRDWSLAALKGKKNVILTFFPKCFTGGCTNHLSSLRDHQGEFDALDTQILAVSVDSAEGEKGQKAYAKQWKFTFPLIPDVDRKVSIIYGSAQNTGQRSARMTVLIDKNGVVRYIDTNVKVTTHGIDMLAKMQELGMGK